VLGRGSSHSTTADPSRSQLNRSTSKTLPTPHRFHHVAFRPDADGQPTCDILHSRSIRPGSPSSDSRNHCPSRPCSRVVTPPRARIPACASASPNSLRKCACHRRQPTPITALSLVSCLPSLVPRLSSLSRLSFLVSPFPGPLAIGPACFPFVVWASPLVPRLHTRILRPLLDQQAPRGSAPNVLAQLN